MIWIGRSPLFASTSDRSLWSSLSAEVIQAALALLTRHPLRTGDAVQLASCFTPRQLAGDVMLLAYDARLNDASRLEGISLMPAK